MCIFPPFQMLLKPFILSFSEFLTFYINQVVPLYIYQLRKCVFFKEGFDSHDQFQKQF